MDANTQVYFSLGEALALLGIFIAIYELMSPTWKTLWAINTRYRASVIILIIIGYLMPFAGVFFEHPTKILQVSVSSIYFQVAGYIFVTLGFVDFIRLVFIEKSKLLNAKTKLKWLKGKNIDKFYEKITQRILLNDYKTATDLLSDNIYGLISLASEHPPYTKSDKLKHLHYSDYAREILEQVFTDDQTMQYVVRHRFDFIHRYADAMNTNPYINGFKRTTAHEIVDVMFKTKNSILYRQISQYRGSSRAINVFDLFFGNKHMLQVSRLYSTSRMWNIDGSRSVPVDEYTTALVEAIETTFDTYVQYSDRSYYYSIFENLRDGVYELLEVAQHLAYVRKDEKLFTDINTPEYKALQDIEGFVWRHHIYMSEKYKTLLKESEYERNAKMEDKYKHSSFLSLMAYASVELSQYVCSIHFENRWNLFHSMLRALHEHHDLDKWTIKHYELYKDYATKQIKLNLRGLYPPLLKGLLSVMPVIQTSIELQNTGQVELWKEIKKILTNDLKQAILTNKKMADKTLFRDALLPENLVAVVSRDKKKISYFTVDTSGTRHSLSLK